MAGITLQHVPRSASRDLSPVDETKAMGGWTVEVQWTKQSDWFLG